MRHEIILFSVGELGSGAHEAHLRALGRRLSGAHLVHEIAHVSWRSFATRRGRARLSQQEREAASILSGSFAVGVHPPRHVLPGLSAWLLRRQVERLRQTSHPILHCRGHLAALSAVLAREAGLSCAILHDVRGDRAAEVAAHPGDDVASRVLAREARAAAGADAHVCVSSPLAGLLKQRHGVSAEVFACAADTEVFHPDEEARKDLRHELGAGDRFLLGYVGSAAGWQRPEAVARLLERITALRPDAALVVLTPDLPAWQACLEGRGLEVDRPGQMKPGARALLRHVPHHDVARWMTAFDALALLRDRDDVNRVASPIKFGEALACGVPVLLTEGIGDASQLVSDRGLGATFGDLWLSSPEDQARLAAFLERQQRDRAGLARACREAAEQLWSWKEQMPRWLALYDRLGASSR